MRSLLSVALLPTLLSFSAGAVEPGDPARGRQAYRACAACHSLQPDRNLTGPSLAGVWERKAGSLASFHRYSPQLKESGVIWNAEALDAWLADPAHFIPDNRMTFPGVKDERTRADLIAFLRSVPASGQPQSDTPGTMGGMTGGMMGGRPVPSLKKLDSEDRVQSITYCGDTYRVVTADGKTHEFWERNLRFKTDSSDEGPQKGAPAILGAGMMGDRASLIFATPEEISTWIKQQCQ